MFNCVILYNHETFKNKRTDRSIEMMFDAKINTGKHVKLQVYLKINNK